jgi:hypothetical protein
MPLTTMPGDASGGRREEGALHHGPNRGSTATCAEPAEVALASGPAAGALARAARGADRLRAVLAGLAPADADRDRRQAPPIRRPPPAEAHAREAWRRRRRPRPPPRGPLCNGCRARAAARSKRAGAEAVRERRVLVAAHDVIGGGEDEPPHARPPEPARRRWPSCRRSAGVGQGAFGAGLRAARCTTARTRMASRQRASRPSGEVGGDRGGAAGRPRSGGLAVAVAGDHLLAPGRRRRVAISLRPRFPPGPVTSTRRGRFPARH